MTINVLLVVRIVAVILPMVSCFIPRQLAPTIPACRMVLTDTLSSPLPRPCRSRKKRIDANNHNNITRAASKQNESSNKKWVNHSIPEKVPRFFDVLNGMTTDDFADDISQIKTERADSDATTGSDQKGASVNSSKTKSTDTNRKVPPTPINGRAVPFDTRSTKTKPSQPANQFRQHNATQRITNSTAGPWRASFLVSKQTQERIQQAGKAFNIRNGKQQHTKSSQRPALVLKTLLKTPPAQCNEANVVCALTLSAKLISEGRDSKTRNRTIDDDQVEFRPLLLDTLDILHQLVQDQRLNTRQLCNAVWALAKHYDRDESLMPPTPLAAALSSDEHLGVAEAWTINDDDNDVNEKDHNAKLRLDSTVNEIARQLAAILAREEESEEESNVPIAKQQQQQQRAKVGELSMASWAYGILRPRRRPPGWQMPAQIGRLHAPQENGKQQSSSSSRTSFITIEKWALPDKVDVDDDDGVDQQRANTDVAPLDVTDQLLDAIGNALCRPLLEEEEEAAMQDRDPLPNTTVAAVQDRRRLESCTWSELANVAWAFASHGHCQTSCAERLLLSLSREAVRRLRQQHATMETSSKMLSRDIAQIIWALGTLQSDNFRLADGLEDLVQAMVKLYGISAGVAEGNSTNTTSAININNSDRPFQHWSFPDLVQLAISLAHARIDELPLLRVLFGEAHHRLVTGGGLDTSSSYQERRSTFCPWEVSVLLWAQARLHLTAAQGQVFDDFASAVPRAIIQAMTTTTKEQDVENLSQIGIGPQEQANLAWSLTVLQQHQSPEAIYVLAHIFRDAARTSQLQRMIQLEHAHQLWQALFLLEEESPAAVRNVPTWFQRYLHQKWQVEKAREKRSSARHRSISQTLHWMNVAHLNEHDEDIDVAIVLQPDATWTHQTTSTTTGVLKTNTIMRDGKAFGASSSSRGALASVSPSVKLAVEFDGPNHFAREQRSKENSSAKINPPRALGHTVLKYRMLKKQGWTVVRVPYYEYDKIPFWASMERQRYLQRLLKTHAKIRFSQVDVSKYKSIVTNRESRFD